jgi:hypothetical protein
MIISEGDGAVLPMYQSVTGSGGRTGRPVMMNGSANKRMGTLNGSYAPAIRTSSMPKCEGGGKRGSEN